MLELTLRVAAADFEEVLDAMLPRLHGGVHVRELGGEVEIAVPAGPAGPEERELRALAGPRLLGLRTSEVSDDWRQRRRDRYEPLVVAGCIAVRPDWAPQSGDPGQLEIVLGQSAAFGTGLHPTTRTCLELLATMPAAGSFLDCGCGSGVLSIAAAKLGYAPVVATDVDPLSVEATRENAARNQVEVEVRQTDVTAGPPPRAGTVSANVPPDVQLALAAALDYRPSLAVLSGFQEPDRDAVVSAWGALDLQVVDERYAHEWLVLAMR